MEAYKQRRRAIAIDFRKEIRDFPRIDKARHYLHPYPAKLLAEIPFFFLANSVFSKRGETILDPFCGTGTVLLEAVKQGRICIGADSNPLARLITRVKLSEVRTQSVLSALSRIRSASPPLERRPYPDVVNIDYWFHPHVKEELQQIRLAIEHIRDSSVKRYLQLCFSRCVRDVSKADPRLSVPVVLRHDQYPQRHPLAAMTRKRITRLRRINVLKRFCDISEANLPAVAKPIAKRRRPSPVLLKDAKDVATELEANSIELVITSPPYLGAQKYIRASSLSIGWLKLNGPNKLRMLENASIGREHFSKKSCTDLPKTGIASADRRINQVAKLNPTRAKIACAYLHEMKHVVRALKRVLKPGGHLILIIGNNHLCGKPFPTERYLRHLTETEGFVVRLRMLDTIRSRGLMTKRNKTANVINRECVLVLQKPWRHGGIHEHHRAQRPRSIEYQFSRKAQNS